MGLFLSRNFCVEMTDIKAVANVDAALLDAVRERNLEAARRLVEREHANVEASGKNGRTALLISCSFQDLRVVRFLIETGRANVQAKDRDGFTALHWACLYNHAHIVQYLVVTAGAVTNVVDYNGRTPLHFACQHGDLAVAQCLIESGGAKVETIDQYGGNALQFACHMSYAPDLVQYLVRQRPNNIDVIDESTYGRNSLHWACWNRNLEIVRCLIEEGHANTKVVTNKGETVLHLASYGIFRADPIALVRYLVETCMLDDFATDQLGRTALHVASESRHYPGVVLYLTSRYPVYDHL
jgi:ankyrin repeat protein